MHEDIFELLASYSQTLNATVVEVKNGQVLYLQGSSVVDIYVVASGYIKLARLDNKGCATITALLDAGKVFGAGLSFAKRAGETATAKGSTQVLRYSNARFNELIEDCKPLARLIINMLIDRQNLIERRLQAILNLDVRSRIAITLHDLAKDAGGNCVHGHEVDVPLTQQELAELVGASRPVVSSQLNILKREGHLDYIRGYFCVNDLSALRAIADRELSVS